MCETPFRSPVTHHTDARMPADYNGTWEMVSNDKFEDVMKAMGKLLLSPNPFLMDNGRDIGQMKEEEGRRKIPNTEEVWVCGQQS